jgi:aspartate/methionine/tyrosine aminotransferase
MKYKRAPIEIESPEEFGYDNIDCNLAESSVPDVSLSELEDLRMGPLVLQYGDHRGKPELRERIAEYGSGLDSDDVLLTVGASGALFMVATSLLDRGDEVVIAFPNYITNIETPRAIGCEVTRLELSFDEGFRVDVDRLEKLITPKTRLVSLTCPHNPTGSVMTESELARVIEIVERQRCYLLFDETYRDMTFGKPLPLAASLSPRAISISSLSKTYGLPGIRMGWLICRDAGLMETFLAAKEQIHICHSVVDEEIAHQYLENRDARLSEINREIASKLGILKNWMNEQNDLEWHEPAGGVVCFPRIRPDLDVDLDEFYRILNKNYKTFVGPGHWFEQDRRHMRIGYGWPAKDKLARGLQNITRAIRKTKR